MSREEQLRRIADEAIDRSIAADKRIAALEAALRTALQQWSRLWANAEWATTEADQREADTIEDCRSILDGTGRGGGG